MTATEYDIRPLELDAIGIARITDLLRCVFPDAQHFTEEVVQWQYTANPDGHAVGFNAWAGEVLAAHYVTIPLRAMVFGKEERGLLSLNTATHPEHQGKGLFTKLAKATYERAAAEGFSFVVGVANLNSTHGFTKKLGFQLVSPLRAMIGAGALPVGQSTKEVDFSPILNKQRLAWRLAHPQYRYSHARADRYHAVLSKRSMKGFRFMLYATPEVLPDLGLAEESMPLLKAYIGLGPEFDWKGSLFVNVPDRFRPSPLNLIFKDLTGSGRVLDKDRVRFQAIDFDTL